MEVDRMLLPCPLCKLPFFEDIHSLRSTLISAATTQLTCPVCNESVMGLDKLTIHLFGHIDTNNINIIENLEEDNSKNINNNSPQMNDTEKTILKPSYGEANPIVCDICDFAFSDQTILELHQKLLHQIIPDEETGIFNFHCHLCSKKFKMRGSLIVHLRVAHYGFSKSGVDKSTNESCSETVKENPKIVDSKQWECDTCCKLFTTKYFLKKHKRLHTGEMPYACSQCNKSFTFQQSYHKHMLYHSSEKPHTCNECGRSFKELSTLQNHVRIHSGERPFSCETCGKCFRQRVSYLVHRRIHTGAMPYDCKGCGKRFRYKVTQRSHKCIPISLSQNSDSTIHNQTQTEQNSFLSVEQNKTFLNSGDRDMSCEVDREKSTNGNDYQCLFNYSMKNNQNTDQTEVLSSTHDLYSLILSPLLPDEEALCLTNSTELHCTEINSTDVSPNENQHNTENIFSNADFLQGN